MSYDYKARFLKPGEDTEIKNIFVATGSEVYVVGEIVTLAAGIVTQAIATSTTVLGICPKACTGVTGQNIPVEVATVRFAEIEMYSDGALTAGVSYALNADGSIDSDDFTDHTLVTALDTTDGAGWTRVKFANSVQI